MKIGGPLTRTTAIVTHRVGNDASHPRVSPGLTTYTAVTLERGVTHDPAFEAWANQVTSSGGPTSIRKEVRVEIYSGTGQLVLAYVLHGAWPSAYQALPILEAGAEGTLIEVLTLQHEGWVRDMTVPAQA